MLVSAQGVVKICDFSVSGQLVRSYATTYVGTMYCTLWWCALELPLLTSVCYTDMAPERIEPTASRAYDVHADVWSLGSALSALAYRPIQRATQSRWSSWRRARFRTPKNNTCTPCYGTLCTASRPVLKRWRMGCVTPVLTWALQRRGSHAPTSRQTLSTLSPSGRLAC